MKTHSTKEGELKNCFLMYDGHFLHTCLESLKLARTQKVTIIKLTLHTTDLLWPLDLSAFKSHNDYWGDIIFRWLRMICTRLTKAKCAAHLCDLKV